MTNPTLETICIDLAMPREEMAYFDKLIEAYDGLAGVRTLDGKKGVVRLFVPAPLLTQVRQVLAGINREIPLTVLTESQPDIS